MQIEDRRIGPEHPPLVIAEIGINHEGDISKAIRMVDDACDAGCECVKFQCHIIKDEMIPNDVIPGNATESIWEIMKRCSLTEAEERRLKAYTESKGMIYLSTPFSRAAAIRLASMNVSAFKIGSGECNNYPLVEHIASYGKPVILSTGMNDIASIKPAVEIIRQHKVSYALMHCTSLYPTPYDKVRLGSLKILADTFPDAVIGLSDHSIGNYTCFAAVALGACILEKHYTSDKSWPGPDIPLSIDSGELRKLIEGSRAIFSAMGGSKEILPEEQPTIDFAYASVVTIAEVKKGGTFTEDNIWVKRPGTGEIKAFHYHQIIGKKASGNLPNDRQLRWSDILETEK